MSHSYICASCRIRSLFLNASRLHPQHQRQLSRTASLLQTTQGPIETRSQRDHRARTPVRQARSLNLQTSPVQEGEVRGRYSGQVLRPEQLLQQLDQPHYDTRENQQLDHENRRFQHHAPGSEDRSKPNDSARASHLSNSNVPPLVWKLRGIILKPSSTDPTYDEDIWRAFKDVLRAHQDSAALKELGYDRSFRNAYDYWIIRVTKQWLHALRTSTTLSVPEVSAPEPPPTPLQALRVWCYFTNRTWRAVWAHVLWLAARNVAEMYAQQSEGSKLPSEAVMVGMQQLITLWHLSMSVEARYQSNETPSDAPISLENVVSPATVDWSFLPDLDRFAVTLQDRVRRIEMNLSFVEALSMIYPGLKDFQPNQESLNDEVREPFDLQSAALVTLDLLQLVESYGGSKPLKAHSDPWLKVMEVSLKYATARKVPPAIIQRMKALDESDMRREYYHTLIERQKLAPIPSDYTLEDQDTQVDSADNQQAEESSSDNRITVHGLTDDQNHELSGNRDVLKRFANLGIKRLGRAVERQDIRAADQVRQDIGDFIIRNNGLQPPQSLYEHLIYSFLCLRSLPMGIDVFNQMVKAGYRPRLETFTVMMKGSEHLKDLKSKEYFWNKMKEIGIQPDTKAWSARIYGLMRKGHTDSGLQALTEMGNEWLTAAKAAYLKMYPSGKKKGVPDVSRSDLLARFGGDVDGVPRPDVVAMNSAITPLPAGRDQLVPKILTWGRSFGLEPDLHTYNALLNVSMRHGMVNEAVNIFLRMKERNIKADGTTWTVLLTAMFEGGFIDGLEPEQQQTKVLELLSSLEADNEASIDVKGYALAINRLLKIYNNPQAAQAVMSRMESRGVEPNAHIYTILMASYFQQTPPNFAAAESLWSYIQSWKGGYGANLDSIFYDRMIEGYAKHINSVGTAPILSFISRMESEGQKPSWRALELVARTLAGAGRVAAISSDRGYDKAKAASGEGWRYASWAKGLLAVCDFYGYAEV